VRKPGTDPDHVRMSDVLCDFCHREWTEDQPMIEGHHGSCICGRCLTVAFRAAVLQGDGGAPAEYQCPMCLERSADRAALGRAGETAWPSPAQPDAVICRRCIELAASALERDPDSGWQRPAAGG
jgi:hypothetical protein